MTPAEELHAAATRLREAAAQDLMTDTTPALSRWQDPEDDGYPSDAYFRAVDKALTAAGITALGWRDESWEYSFELDEAFTGDYARLYVTWRVSEESDPLSGTWESLPDGICGWYWVPYSRNDQLSGDFAETLGLEVLAEPDEVAAAVAELVFEGAPTTWSDAIPPGGGS